MNLILAHAGVPRFQGFWPLARECGNLYFDISGIYVTSRTAARLVSAVGAERLQWGSDGATCIETASGIDFEPSLRAAREFPCGDAEKQLVSWDNFPRLTGEETGDGGAKKQRDLSQ